MKNYYKTNYLISIEIEHNEADFKNIARNIDEKVKRYFEENDIPFQIIKNSSKLFIENQLDDLSSKNQNLIIDRKVSGYREYKNPFRIFFNIQITSDSDNLPILTSWTNEIKNYYEKFTNKDFKVIVKASPSKEKDEEKPTFSKSIINTFWGGSVTTFIIGTCLYVIIHDGIHGNDEEYQGQFGSNPIQETDTLRANSHYYDSETVFLLSLKNGKALIKWVDEKDNQTKTKEIDYLEEKLDTLSK